MSVGGPEERCWHHFVNVTNWGYISTHFLQFVKSIRSWEQGYWRCFLDFLTRVRLHISYNSLHPLGVQQQGYQRCFLDKPGLHYICDAGYPPLTLCNLVGEGIGTPCLFASCLKVSNMFLSFSSTYLQNKCVIERHPLRVEVVTQSF